MQDYRYRAFIAYSHADLKVAEDLQRALEAYSFRRASWGNRPPMVPRRAG